MLHHPNSNIEQPEHQQTGGTYSLIARSSLFREMLTSTFGKGNCEMIRGNIKTIMRGDIDDNSSFGFVIEQNKDLILILVEDDFWINGYQILRFSDIDSIKSTATNRHCTKILKREGLLEGSVRPEIDLSSWRSIFRDLKKRDKYVIVEDEIEEQFLIGPIARVNKQSVSIKYFDGTGHWGDVLNIKYTDITSVCFDSRYIQYHRKYVDKV